jgi:hypothetical protein
MSRDVKAFQPQLAWALIVGAALLAPAGCSSGSNDASTEKGIESLGVDVAEFKALRKGAKNSSQLRRAIQKKSYERSVTEAGGVIETQPESEAQKRRR